ncbi:peptidase S1 [Lysobacter daejeonensis GH1-9]|uniref:Probable periplasmic serine endoprotease DegP-like n=1 Tax=Lysobacter daejeonensis GH1-9 TaxID=1385517 RepID=A0A0A0F282_9GAMM|nr:DegQ family serine endoprotease [Lysobacter daejeonensis]KGM55507.1 peptidase S1 [Lysobacter daejeonensis GH1-9]
MNRPFQTLALASALVALIPAACSAQSPSTPIAPPPAATPAMPLVTGLPDFTALVQKVGPAVVSVTAEVGMRRNAREEAAAPDMEGMPEIFRRFFGPDTPFPGGPQQRRGVSQGTGFFISQDGYLLTNHHVVDGADSVKVRLNDRREFTARVIGSDQPSDVALLKVDAKDLPFLRVANAANTKPGQWVVAIGSPFGLDHSVTAGIVSAVGRTTSPEQQYVPFIQTDVAINQGNSGGPLLNTSGEVVGINSQIFSRSGGYMGVSFAIPIDVAMNSAEQLRATGRVSRGQLGVQVQQMTADAAKALGLPSTAGALVQDVVPGSAAAKAGIERMDVIRSVNGRPVNTSSDLPPLIGGLAPGSKAKLGVVRDGREREMTVVLGALANAVAANDDADAPATPGATTRGSNALGFAAQDLDASQRQRLGLDKGEGVVVARVTGDGAAEAGISPGDVVLSVGRQAVGTVAALDRALASVKEGDTVMLLVRSRGGTRFVAVTADKG